MVDRWRVALLVAALGALATVTMAAIGSSVGVIVAGLGTILALAAYGRFPLDRRW